MENMNDNESILAELRRIGAWADMQRKITKWSFMVMAVLIPAIIVFGIVIVKREAASMEETYRLRNPRNLPGAMLIGKYDMPTLMRQ